MTFDATVGGATATSLVEVAFAVSYFAARMETAKWDAIAGDAPAQEKVLMAATARVQMERWRGFVPSLTQALCFPRVGVYDREKHYLSSSAIPVDVQRGVCEVALHLLNNAGTDLMAPDGLQQLRSVKVGPLDIAPNPDGTALWSLPPAALRWLAPYLDSGTGQTRLVRG